MSIGRKLTLILGLTCVIPLLLMCAVLIGVQFTGERANLGTQLATLAQITAWNSSTAIVAGDTDSARSVLAGLQADPQILAGCLYDANRRLFAAYRPPGSPF